MFFYLVALPSSTHGFQSHPVCDFQLAKWEDREHCGVRQDQWEGVSQYQKWHMSLPPSFHGSELRLYTTTHKQLHVGLVVQSSHVLRSKRMSVWRKST